jgi:nickel-dependent lactate racemase
MQAVAEPFDIVVTSNSGFPLDLNLYQGVKGLSAAARIVRPGGTLILACECSDGVPSGSPFDQLLRQSASPEQLLKKLEDPATPVPEQWQAQILAQIQQRAKVLVHSSLEPERIRACHLEPCEDVSAAVHDRLKQLGSRARVAALPYGPLTIPYLKTS